MDNRPIILNKDPKEKEIYIGNANYRFDEKKYTIGGPLSIVLFVVSAAVCTGCICSSYQLKGNGGMSVGAAGVMGLLTVLAGLIIGIMSFQEENKHYLLSKLGVILNGAGLLLWACIYLIGI